MVLRTVVATERVSFRSSTDHHRPSHFTPGLQSGLYNHHLLIQQETIVLLYASQRIYRFLCKFVT